MKSRWMPMVWRLVLGLAMAGSVYPGLAENFSLMDENAIYHFHQGQKWMEIRQYEAAIREYQIGLKLKPDTTVSAAIYNDMGLAYTKIKDYPKAIVSFQRALALNPGFSLYYQNLVQAYQESGAMETAEAQLQETTALNPESVQSWYLLGLLYKARGDNEAAREAFSTFVKLAPHSELADAARQMLGSL